MSPTDPVPSGSAAPLRLYNAFSGTRTEDLEKCYYTIPRFLHTYFFRRIFAGERGIYQNLISPFILALYDECQRRGLVGERAIFDPANEQIVAGILRDLNFRPADIRPEVPNPKRGTSKRRSVKGSDVVAQQPEPGTGD